MLLIYVYFSGPKFSLSENTLNFSVQMSGTVTNRVVEILNDSDCDATFQVNSSTLKLGLTHPRTVLARESRLRVHVADNYPNTGIVGLRVWWHYYDIPSLVRAHCKSW